MKKLLSLSIFLFLISLFTLSSINVDGAITVGTITTDKSGYNPGETATITIKDLTNTGTNAVTVSLSSTELIKGTDKIGTPVISSISLSASGTVGDIKNQTFTFVIPSKLLGTYSATITAQDSGDLNNKDTEVYSLTINSKSDLTFEGLTDNKLTISGQKDFSAKRKFTLTNKGSTVLTIPVTTGIVVKQTDKTFTNSFEDDDGDKIQFTFVNSDNTNIAFPLTLNPGENKEVYIKSSIDQDSDTGSYSGTVTVTATELTTQLSPFNLEVNVDPEICEAGRVKEKVEFDSHDSGNLILDLDNPDSGDNFNPGEKISIEGSVENKANEDKDVIVEAVLYNIDRNKVVERVETDSFEVVESEDESFTLDLEVPVDDSSLKEGDKYRLYIKVYEDSNEDENCNYDDLDMDFDRQDHQVVITRAEVTPSVASCNANVNFAVEVQNAGKKVEERTSIKLRESELGLNYETDYFSLAKFDKSGDNIIKTLTYKIPNGIAEKDYFVEVLSIFDGGKKTDSELVKLTIKGCSAVQDSLQLSLVQDSITATPGKLFGFPFKLRNTGSTVQTYSVEISTGVWANQLQDQTVTLQPGQETTVYSYLTPKSDLTSGSYTLDIKVKQDNKVVKTQTATVQIPQAGNSGGTPTGGTTYQPSVSLDSIWRNLAGSTAFWIIAIIIVFALVIYILTILLRPR